MKKVIVLLIILLLIIGGVMAVAWTAVDDLIEPTTSNINAPDYFEDTEDVTIKTTDEINLRGWIVNKGNDSAVIVLAHGNGGNRVNMVDRAEMLVRNGYSVFLYDARAHGQSEGDRKTFGFMEARDLTSVYNYLKSQGYEKVGFIGFSLGGVSFLLSDSRNDFDAAVIESPYTSISSAVEKRLENRFGTAGILAAPLLLWTTEYRLDLDSDDISPGKTAPELRTPVLFIGGGEDERSGRTEILSLYEKTTGPRDVWIIEDAGHEDFYQHDRQKYESRVLLFFDEYLLDGGV